MAGKRVAGRELNHDNWNDEEDEEDAGEFKKASEDILSKRVRKVAKRRVAPGESEGGGGQVVNPFSGFGGFGSFGKGPTAAASTPLSATSASTPFSFLSKLPAAAAPQPPAPAATKTNGATKSANDNTSGSSDYNAKVRALNVAFAEWIKGNVDKNSLCDLRPVFADYEKYMKELNEAKGQKSVSEKKTVEKEESPAKSFSSILPQKPAAEMPSPAAQSFTFGRPATTTATSPANIFSSVNTSSIFSAAAKDASPAKPAESKGFSFGLAPASTAQPVAPPAFSFGLQKTSTTTTLPGAALFGGIGSTTTTTATPFSFANVTQAKPTAADGGGGDQAAGEDADEEPPKNEFVPVVEEDSLFSKRCKVFVKTGADYADRGVGTLYLKKVDEKVQMLVRADTNLGNILLNIILQEGLPTSRLGKNNVMVVCVPTPESKPPPTPVLVRVKTGEEADELLSILEKYKKGAD